MILAAISEYAALATGQHGTLRPPADLGEAARWLFIGVAVFVALRLVLGVLKLLTRRPRTPIGKRFRESALAPCFASQAEALTFLRSAEIAPRVTLDRDWVESLLLARRPSAPRLRKAA